MKHLPSFKAMRMGAAVLCAAALLGGCAGIGPDKPVHATQYDFGAGNLAPVAQARLTPLPPLALADVDGGAAFDGTAMMYRLAYADGNQLRPYAQARWSMPPAQLVRQRLREVLGQRRAVLNPGETAVLARTDGVAPRVLRVEIEEFSQLFDAPAASAGVVRLRVTLMDNTLSGEKLLAQRSVVARSPAPSADASGGVRALAAATDAAAQEIAQWLEQAR